MSEQPGFSDPSASRPSLPKFVESQEFGLQPSHLEIGQHIVDQPPFTAVHDLVPDVFFITSKHATKEEGLYRALIILGQRSFYLRSGAKDVRASQTIIDLQGCINKKFKKWDATTLLTTFSSIVKMLEPYPDIFQYLRDKKEGFKPNGMPDVQIPPPGWYRPEMTFAAYQHARIRAGEIDKYQGLADIRPRGFSNADDVLDAMPAKPPANIRYRLLRSSDATR